MADAFRDNGESTPEHLSESSQSYSEAVVLLPRVSSCNVNEKGEEKKVGVRGANWGELCRVGLGVYLPCARVCVREVCLSNLDACRRLIADKGVNLGTTISTRGCKFCKLIVSIFITFGEGSKRLSKYYIVWRLRGMATANQLRHAL